VFARHLVEAATLEGAALELAVRLNWYRSLPLSCVERLEVSLDGIPVAADRTTLDVDGGADSADGPWWPVLAAGRVRVALDAPPAEGEHRVDLLIGTRIPYLVDPAGNAVVIVDRAQAVVSR
jgi:hypothetical protein